MVPILALILQGWLGPTTVPAANQTIELVNEVYPVPASDWRYVEFTLRQLPVLVRGGYDAPPDAGNVRLLLLRRSDLKRMEANRPHGILAISEPGAHGALEHRLRVPGDYVLVVDNRQGTAPASVHLRVALDFGGRNGASVSFLAPRRKLVVILLSFGVFFAIVTWSARRLLHAIR